LQHFGARNIFILITNFVLNYKEQAGGDRVFFYLAGSVKNITEISKNLTAIGKSKETRDLAETMAAV